MVDDLYKEFGDKPVMRRNVTPWLGVFHDEDTEIVLPEVPERHETGPITGNWLEFEVRFFDLIKEYMSGVFIAPTNLYSIANGELAHFPMMTYTKIRVSPVSSPKSRVTSYKKHISPNLDGVIQLNETLVCNYQIQFNCWGDSEEMAEETLQRVKDFFNAGGDRIISELGVRSFSWIHDLTDIEIVRYRIPYPVRSTQYTIITAHGSAYEVNEIRVIDITLKKPAPTLLFASDDSED